MDLNAVNRTGSKFHTHMRCRITPTALSDGGYGRQGNFTPKDRREIRQGLDKCGVEAEDLGLSPAVALKFLSFEAVGDVTLRTRLL
jgi:hypothetical protein